MNRVVRIGICEDDDRDARELERLLTKSGVRRALPIDLTRYPSAEALLTDFSPGKFDILFLDIYLTKQTGMEAAQQIRDIDADCLFIFTTSSREHALAGYSVQALHYLIKPIVASELEEALDRSLHLLKDMNEQSISVMLDRRSREIPLKDILYVEAQNKQCSIHTRSEVLLARITMNQLASLLPTPPFLRCHRSGIVNLGHVRSINQDFIMENGDIVCIRQVDLREIKAQYMHYLKDITRHDLRA